MKLPSGWLAIQVVLKGTIQGTGEENEQIALSSAKSCMLQYQYQPGRPVCSLLL